MKGSSPSPENQHLPKLLNSIFDKTFFIQSAVTGELMLQNPIIPFTDDKMITD